MQHVTEIRSNHGLGVSLSSSPDEEMEAQDGLEEVGKEEGLSLRTQSGKGGYTRIQSLSSDPAFSMCVLGEQQHCEEAKALDIPHMDTEALEKINKNKELVKKLAKNYDAFLVSESLIKKIPQILGPGLNKAGKFPFLLTHNENMVAKVDEVKSTIKFQMKKLLCLAVAVGHLKMTDEERVYNSHLAINFSLSLLKKKWQSVQAVCIKSTIGKPQYLY
ncbi:LOW QUALITY PROTEIN: 60S ribosomal protein L10a-like [Talpa occidentalis]|uniref:LOW QUALITY PROTEIN: 60S ribosomal protein L10a-like n=1 Tax=Talpa occidentalis TaxID=50954 RepID=UPI00188F9A5E|nr:LOW QUALITY PROTEIN: 60S ribosomal protein L10a-like [Talpa occidentalis]